MTGLSSGESIFNLSYLSFPINSANAGFNSIFSIIMAVKKESPEESFIGRKGVPNKSSFIWTFVNFLVAFS